MIDDNPVRAALPVLGGIGLAVFAALLIVLAGLEIAKRSDRLARRGFFHRIEKLEAVLWLALVVVLGFTAIVGMSAVSVTLR